MPLHCIHAPSGAFTDEDKEALSKKITGLYQRAGLPAFYVVVLFIPVEEKNVCPSSSS